MENSGHVDVVCAIIISNGLVLAARRDPKRAFPLHWEFPGGKVEPKESPDKALHRELQEELCLKVEITRQLDPVEFSDGKIHIRLIPFVCTPAQKHAPVAIDHTEIRWIKPDEADQLTWAPADIPLIGKLNEFI